MLTNLAVLTRVTLWTGALILVRAGVAARPSIQTRWAGATIVQICSTTEMHHEKASRKQPFAPRALTKQPVSNREQTQDTERRIFFVRALLPPPTSISFTSLQPALHLAPQWFERTFIAELTTPVGFAETLPRFIASAMDTARVWNALITVLALPAILTPSKKQELGITIAKIKHQ